MTNTPSFSTQPHFIVFEGLDGAGKTTAAKSAAEALGATYLTTPSTAVRAYRDELIASFGGNQEAAQHFYLATVFDASSKVRSLLRAGGSVVLDRYFLSTQAYAAFRGSELGLDENGRLLQPAHLTVFLDAPLEVRRARLAARGQSAADRETLSPEADARIRAEHMKRSQLGVVGRFLRVDGAMNPERVLHQILGAVAELMPNAHATLGDESTIDNAR
jgi:dTMP kinase